MFGEVKRGSKTGGNLVTYHNLNDRLELAYY